MQTLKNYFRFLNNWDVSILRPTLSHRQPLQAPHNLNSPLKVNFIRFELSDPQAHSVHLAGDFNQWSGDSLSLARNKKGTWEVLVPLPPGKYHYLYIIDGQWTLDPKNSEIDYRGPQKTSVKIVP
ncbi:MAG: hypothetical protein HY399_08120 [Elusimicrobia bacterium]|nr:hypothetical protein [Elusimicrobiota bacterium]